METTVEETETQTQTDPNAGKGFGEIVLEQKEAREKPAVTTPPVTIKETITTTQTPATTPIKDVLDAAFEKNETPETKEEDKPKSPDEEFANVTDGVKSEQVRERMVGMRGKIKSLWEENQELRKRVEQQPATRSALEDPEVQSLIKAKDAELQKASEALLAFNVESHPEFVREFTEPRQKLARNAAQRLQNYGGNGQALLDALYLPEGIRRDEAVAALLDTLPDHAKSKITMDITRIEDLDSRAAEKRANAPQTWEELSARDAEARRKKAEEYHGQVKGVFEDVKRELGNTPFFRQFGDDIKGAGEWNRDRDGAFERGLAHIIGTGNNMKRSLVTAIKGERFDAVADMLAKERDRRVTLERKLAEYEGVQPTVRGSSPPASSESEDENNLPFGEIVARRAARRSEGDD